jgi:hypothetical protein
MFCGFLMDESILENPVPDLAKRSMGSLAGSFFHWEKVPVGIGDTPFKGLSQDAHDMHWIGLLVNRAPSSLVGELLWSTDTLTLVVLIKPYWISVLINSRIYSGVTCKLLPYSSCSGWPPAAASWWHICPSHAASSTSWPQSARIGSLSTMRKEGLLSRVSRSSLLSFMFNSEERFAMSYTYWSFMSSICLFILASFSFWSFDEYYLW